MNIRILHLNKNKEKKILLLHGLFSSSGYWLPYIEELKNFQLIIPNIDYIIISKDIKRNLPIFMHQINKIQNIDYVISHSYGTILAKYFEIDSNYINICPIHSMPITREELFINEITKRSKIDSTQIKLIIRNTAKLLDSVSVNNINDPFNLYPSDDVYFDYKIECSNKHIIFKGDHFDISNAFQKIYTKNLLK